MKKQTTITFRFDIQGAPIFARAMGMSLMSAIQLIVTGLNRNTNIIKAQIVHFELTSVRDAVIVAPEVPENTAKYSTAHDSKAPA